MKIAKTGLEISDKAVKSVIGLVTARGVNGGINGYCNLSAKETAQGVANYFRSSSERFLKEEEFIVDTVDRLNSAEAQWFKAGMYPKPIKNMVRYFKDKTYTKLYFPKFYKACNEHNTILGNTLSNFLLAPKKEYPTTVQTLNNKFMNNTKLPMDERVRKYDKYFKVYVNKVFKMVKQELA